MSATVTSAGRLGTVGGVDDQMAAGLGSGNTTRLTSGTASCSTSIAAKNSYTGQEKRSEHCGWVGRVRLLSKSQILLLVSTIKRGFKFPKPYPMCPGR